MSQDSMGEICSADECPACSGRAFRRRPVPRQWIGRRVFERAAHRLGLAECLTCGLVLTRPRPSGVLLSQFYGGSDYTCHGNADRDDVTSKADILLDRVESVARGGKRLLDFGCGSGWLLRRAEQRGWSAIGYDMGARAIDTCRSRGIEVVADLDELEPRSVDAIVLHHVFEHLEEPRETLRCLRKLLSPRGSLFIEVPNAASLRARLSPSWASKLGIDERYRAFPIHLHYFTPRTLERLLQREGFDVSIETYGLGVDELIVRQRASKSAASSLTRKSRAPSAFRNFVKRVLFGAELGENILAVAAPRVAVKQTEMPSPAPEAVSA